MPPCHLKPPSSISRGQTPLLSLLRPPSFHTYKSIDGVIGIGREVMTLEEFNSNPNHLKSATNFFSECLQNFHCLLKIRSWHSKLSSVKKTKTKTNQTMAKSTSFQQACKVAWCAAGKVDI